MGWKNFPTWLKGGITGLCIAGFFSMLLIPSIIIGAMVDQDAENMVGDIYHVLSFPLDTDSGSWGIDALFEIPITMGITYFLTGSLIGWIIGKIKSK